MSKTSELIKKSHSKRGAPGTLKRKVQGKMTIAKAKALKNKPGATTLDKKQANFFINMQRARNEEVTTTANIPNPAQTSQGPVVAFLDRRSKKKKKLLKKFREYNKQMGIE